jgi:hypothetical protein
MQQFQGYLRSFVCETECLTIRFFAGTIDPIPKDEPVLEVVILEPTSMDQAIECLKQIEREDAWLYLSQPDDSSLQIESENGTEYQLLAQRVDSQAQQYGPGEWEWLAHRNHEHAQNLNGDLVKARTRLNKAIELIAEQQARIEVKAQRHESGTTARTLYDQHAKFLARLRAETEA